jgi:hypothetical protein
MNMKRETKYYLFVATMGLSTAMMFTISYLLMSIIGLIISMIGAVFTYIAITEKDFVMNGKPTTSARNEWENKNIDRE